MAKLNRASKAPKAVKVAVAPTGPVKTKRVADTVTHEGAPAFSLKAKSELFTLAVTNMVGENTFYEKAGDRDARFTALVHKVAVRDPAWMLGFLSFLRGTANMRTASVVAAAEAVKARLDAGIGTVPTGAKVIELEADPVTSRKLIDAALQRADEPGELLAYWLANHGRNVPKPVKRGLADAAKRLYNEYTLLKYDTASHGVRFGDVLDLVHPTAGTPDQGALFRHALDRRHGRGLDSMHNLPMVLANHNLRTVANTDQKVLLNADALKAAGMTWEDALSLVGSKVNKAALWEAMIPNMGIMALIRNLRNFDEAGVSDVAAAKVISRLINPEQIAKSRQLPFRFYTAYTQAPSDRWKHALGIALDLACSNVPELPGRTLVLIDTSASMTWKTISEKSKVTPAQAAAVLGFVLAKRNGADVWQWASTRRQFKLTKGRTAMQEIAAFLDQQGACGGGTNLDQALQAYGGHDRVVILSDMQTMPTPDPLGYRHSLGYNGDRFGINTAIPAHVPVYAWDLQGYGRTPIASTGNRHQLAGFSDSAFRLMPLLELGESPDWDALFNA